MEPLQLDYIKLFLDSILSRGGPYGLIALLFLFLGRMLPMVALSPFLGARVLPHPVKVTLGVTFFAIFLPTLLATTKTELAFNFHLIALILKEAIVGFLLGNLMSVPFIIVQTSGMVIDHQKGGASLMVNDPTVQNQSSPQGTLFNMMLISLFFGLNGPFYFLEAVMDSYSCLPADRFLPSLLFQQSSIPYTELIALLNDVMVIAIRLASPALIAILMTDLFLGIANRLAPQVQVTFLGLPLKSLIGLCMVTFGWQMITTEMVKEPFVFIEKIKLWSVAIKELL